MQLAPAIDAAPASARGGLAGATHELEYRPDIDGLRAIAVLSVVAFHAAPGRFPGGFIGVDVFFVISGFLISSIILRQLIDGRFRFSDFYARRILRIFPPLLTVLLALSVAGFLFFTQEEYSLLGKHIASGAGFLSNLVLWGESGYFDSSADFKPLLHLWSLGIEEQFYMAWPLLLFLAWSRGWNIALVTLLIAGVSLASSAYQTQVNPVAAFYSPLSRFWELLLGCGVALAPREQISSTARNFISAAGLILLLLGLSLIDKQTAFPGAWAMLPTVGTALLIAAGPGAFCNRLLFAQRALVAIGLISYSLYLWHWPLLSFFRVLQGSETPQWLRGAAVCAAFVLAALSYRYIERPIRSATGRVRNAALLAVAMTTVGVLGLVVYQAGGGTWRPSPPSISNTGEIGHDEFFKTVAGSSHPCEPEAIRSRAGNWKGTARCFQSKTGAQQVAIIGDSHGEHLFPGLARSLPGVNVVFYGMDGLPFSSNDEYAAIYEHVLASHSIEKVLLAAAWNRKLSSAAPAAWRPELERTLARLVSSGKQVYLVADVHAFAFAPNRCKYANRLWIAHKCSEPAGREKYEDIFDALAQQHPAIHVVTPNGALCPDGNCYMALNGKLLYRDEHHLTSEGSTLAGTAIAAGMQRQTVLQP